MLGREKQFSAGGNCIEALASIASLSAGAEQVVRRRVHCRERDTFRPSFSLPSFPASLEAYLRRVGAINFRAGRQLREERLIGSKEWRPLSSEHNGRVT